MTKDSKLHQYDRAFGLPAITITHERIHRGEFFTAAHQQLVGSGLEVDYLIRVAAGSAAHSRPAMNVAHDMLGTLYSDPTSSADGTPVLAVNRNGFSSTTAELLMFHTPTVSDPGTQMMQFYAPAGDKKTASGGQGDSFEEWILPPGDYLVRVSNNIIAPAAAGRAGFIFDFYEPVSGTSP